MRIIKVKIHNIKIGDCVSHNNEIKTVGKESLRYDPFMGTSLFGDSYNLGTRLVTKIIFNTYKKQEQ